jgi:hypothetical protein
MATLLNPVMLYVCVSGGGEDSCQGDTGGLISIREARGWSSEAMGVPRITFTASTVLYSSSRYYNRLSAVLYYVWRHCNWLSALLYLSILQPTIRSTDYPLHSVWRYSNLLSYVSALMCLAILQTTICCALLCLAILQATVCGALLYLAILQGTICSTLPVDMLVGSLVSCGLVGVPF